MLMGWEKVSGFFCAKHPAGRCGKRILTPFPVVWLCTLCVAAMGEERLTMWGTPPREKPQRTKAAEGFPPLPLPAIPQRRTEKKRPPAPPKLLANLAGFSFPDWKGSPGAVDELLKSAQEHLNVWYGWEHLDMPTLVRAHTSGIDHRTPILYLCAYYPLDLTDDQRSALQSYVLAGGTMIINCCGQNTAFASVKNELARMLPRYEFRLLPVDHPIFHAYYAIEKVRYPLPSINPLDEGANVVDAPRLWGITLGTRAAVIVSHEDLACGWNKWSNPTVKRVDPTDATRLGLNIITYVTSELRLAKYLAKTRDVAGPSIRPREQLVLAQIIHDGNWNPHPSAVPLFLKELASNTSIAVQFERQTLSIKDPGLFGYPLLYMTGTWDPRLTREETALLHRYLTTGGVLLADAAAGSREFDEAFRALCQQLFPEQPLTALPPDHPIYSSFHRIETLRANHEQEPIRPVIEAVVVNDRPVILYSRLGLGDGWAQQFSIYARAYTADDALRLGTNLIVSAMQ